MMYCNVLAVQHGLDPAGYAGCFGDAVLVETPLPWKREIYEKAGILPQEFIDLLALWLERYRAGQPYNHRPLMIAPDPEYARPGHRRVIYFARQPGAFARFERDEYLVPNELAGGLIWALYEARHELHRFDAYRVPTSGSLRDILVCTHGTVDVACAKFGYPLYQQLRTTYAHARLRVWRVSHFGGHVFAPTLVDLPTGHYWAYIGAEQAEGIVERCGDLVGLRGHYRGWAGITAGFAQAAEREMWQQEGWAWFDYLKSCTVTAEDANEEDPSWMELNIEYTTPAGEPGCYCARVEIARKIETLSSTGNDKPHTYAQYVVTRLEKQQSHHSVERALQTERKMERAKLQ